jgi:WD40 repeat protein
VRYAGNGASLVISEGSARQRSGGGISELSAVDARLHVLAADDMRELRSIDLGLSSDPRVYGPADIQVSPAGDRLAVALSPIDLVIGFGGGASCKAFEGSEVRVYDLGTGRALWQVPFENARIGGLEWSPDGLSLALTLQSGQGGDRWARTSCLERTVDKNLLILETGSGRVLSGINTGDLAGPVCFGPNNEVFTAPFHFIYRNSKDQKVKVWNAQTGQLERTIGYPGRDVHNLLALSRDGRVLVGYVGKERLGFSWHALEEMEENLDQKFAIWDARSGALIGTSPSLAPLTRSPGRRIELRAEDGWRPPAIRKLSGRIVRLQADPGHLRLQVAAEGSEVLAYWAVNGPPLLFDVPDTRTAHRR